MEKGRGGDQDCDRTDPAGRRVAIMVGRWPGAVFFQVFDRIRE